MTLAPLCITGHFKHFPCHIIEIINLHGMIVLFDSQYKDTTLMLNKESCIFWCPLKKLELHQFDALYLWTGHGEVQQCLMSNKM